ncbi:hypothetical protein HD597_000698 [Nonomuraea thailandensis]|uniref:Transposase n=1 Tax=Nonomuraea thailandensis TaxID=1188745 RepID=A0A9X2JYC9_9ACTN|nr:hypothetical protein [Nonomuraea thailandensis]
MPAEFGAWPAVSDRFRQWRGPGVFEALLEGLIAEAAKRGGVDLSLAGVDSTMVRARHDAAGMHLSHDVLAALDKAAAGEDKAQSKRVTSKNRTGQGPKRARKRTNGDAFGAAGDCG